ncbi:pantetheine-phosphate adenylyltransferase [Candidatus Woesearchaeota archaeon]|nr:pantetheine-phosphate adenylyltransferase [Candidatus Woesearchaeota archaeon]
MQKSEYRTKKKEDNSKKKALFAFSADPITIGHIDIIERVITELGFGAVEAAIAENPSKKYLFSLEERVNMARKSLAHIPQAQVTTCKGMTVVYAYEQMIDSIVKGIRNKEDLKYEKDLAKQGETQIPGIKTQFLVAKPELAHISSTAAKGVQLTHQGFTNTHVPLNVKQALEARISSRYMIGITGEIAAGKSYVTEELLAIGKKKGITVYNIDLDKIGHDILEKLNEPRYVAIRREIGEKFGNQVVNPDGFINRKALGEVVFNNPGKLKELNRIMELPMKARLMQEIQDKKGFLLFNAALIAEAGMSYLCNNNTFFITVDKKVQAQRMINERKLTSEQIERRLNSQYTGAQKKAKLEERIRADHHGTIWTLDTTNNPSIDDVEKIFDKIIKDIDIYGELRFMSFWNRLGADGKYYDAYTRIRDEMLKPHRHYHTLSHIVSMLNEFDNLKHMLQNPDQVEFSIWTHDYSYTEKSRVNEEKSAEFSYKLCKEALLPENFANGVKRINIVTKHNIAPQSIDEAIMIDLDLMVLGQSQEIFDDYDDKIAKEYEWMNKEEYKKGRANILQGFLEKANNHKLYHTDYFRNKYEAQAIENLERAIEGLKK